MSANRLSGGMWPRVVLAAVRLGASALCAIPSGCTGSSGLPGQTQAPPPLPARPISFPPFEEIALENGLRVVLVSYGTQPVVSVRLYTGGGRATDPAELSGLAALGATLLTRGTPTRSATDIASEVEGIGASLSATAGRDFLTVTVVTLTEHVDAAMGLLADVARNATFPEEEVELARSQMLSSLQADLGNPQIIASRHFSAILYGAEHPYGTAPTPATVQSIDRDELLAYRDRALRPAGALLLIAGRIARPDAEALARRHFGSWGGDEAPQLEIPEVSEPPSARIYLVHRPGAAQSVIVVGNTGVTAQSPDFFPLVVANRILGGGGDSRLFKILREEHGWTYDPFSQFTRGRGRGTFLAQASVRAEVTDSAVVETLAQMRRLRDEPVPASELDGAKSFLAGSFPLRLETADQVADQLSLPLLLGLPIDDVTLYPDRVRAVTSADLQRVARAHLRPEAATIVVVGDGARILEALEAIAPVEIRDVEGSPLPRGDILGAAAPTWDGERLEPGGRRYEVLVNGAAIGAAEYRLDRDDNGWVSTATVSASGATQRTRLRFTTGLTPVDVVQEISQGPVRIAADISVSNGRLVGRIELPEALGGARDYDQELGPGILLAGMDEYALAVAPLADGSRFTLPYLDLTRGEVVPLEARVTGAETIGVLAGTFATWRVEISGGATPAVLFLRREAPHILVRQELAGNSIRYDLVALTP